MRLLPDPPEILNLAPVPFPDFPTRLVGRAAHYAELLAAAKAAEQWDLAISYASISIALYETAQCYRDAK